MPPLIRKIEPGDTVGRCRIIRELGRGGVGTVYLATHQTLKIDVAVKVLSPSLSMENPDLGDRFIREAQLAARIRHPNVIAVMDAAHDEMLGAYFIIMEYVGGGSLAWHLRHGPLPEAKALAIITGIAHALVIAEENRIVHRDIKPENIMLDVRGTSKLADLGLAKNAIDSTTSLTLGGSFMGTPAYMSPDQARDAKVADTRDDIYSLGASFFECLTGEAPFQGETPYNIMSELLTKPTPQPRDVRPGISVSADLICRKMMAKTRDLRYCDARALLKDLEHARTFGDAGLDGLDASNFDAQSVREHRRERRREEKYGIETSSEGVYAEPADNLPSMISRPSSTFAPPRRATSDVFGAAALLIALVLLTTLVMAWAGPNNPLAFVKNQWTNLIGEKPPAEALFKTPMIPKEKEAAHPMPKKQTSPSAVKPEAPLTIPVKTPAPTPSVTPTHAVVTTVTSDTIPTAPVALPSDLNGTNMAIPPVPVTTSITTALPGAFTARNIAEKSLDPALVSPTGHADLLKAVGKRDDTQAAPSTWTFYFYDKAAAGHARMVTVTDGQVVKSGEDLVDFASPYSDHMALAEDKVQKDSTDILAIAQTLVPDAAITSSEFILQQQKNSVPMWKVTFWGKNPDGGEKRLGEITALAEDGKLISKNLK